MAQKKYEFLRIFIKNVLNDLNFNKTVLVLWKKKGKLS